MPAPSLHRRSAGLPTLRTTALAGAVVLAASGAVTLGTAIASRDGAGTTALPALPPAAADEVLAVPGAAQPARAAPGPVGSSVRLQVPEVGLDVPVLPLAPADGALNPPTIGEAYWVQPYGDPVGDAEQADNTLYIAAHSSSGGGAAFDPLLDRRRQRGALEPGDVVTVRTPQGSVDYTVQRTQRYATDELAGAEEVWEASPGRLVLITCFQRGDGRPSTENLVVVAGSSGA
ncbi:class F sortase [Quadrisphaera sp. DSM 44207]|uniref:class F sortase n=1 Tax=Quadrisphaera sp. DSM 44207 TaxID=1881057 RepID=UPI000885DA2B|nr:class F sortase [Quadrisphaera sp. DSM 44207]SDQ88542.1 Sortase family protein [Quadrisphaera sp. DSM 44207]